MTLLALLFIALLIVLLYYVLPLTGAPVIVQRILWAVIAVVLFVVLLDLLFPASNILNMRIGR